jgi:hypothetical protein
MGALLDEALGIKKENVEEEKEYFGRTEAEEKQRIAHNAKRAKERRAVTVGKWRATKANQPKKNAVLDPIAPQVEKVEVVPPKRPEVRSKLPYRGFLNDSIRTKLREMMKEGATINTMANALGVATRTISQWKNKVDDLEVPEDRIRAVADDMVENSLFKRAIGYEAPKELVQFSKEGEIWRTDTFQHIPPDPDSAKFWLKNRQPTKWRDHIDTDITLIPRLVVQTHMGDEVLHDASTIDRNTPKLLSDAAGSGSGEFGDEDKGVGSPPDDEDEKTPGNEVFEQVPGKPEVDATNSNDSPPPEAK